MTTGDELTRRLTEAERDRTSPPCRVRDAASLIVLDRSGPAVLMGRRSGRHVFMPHAHVFPGGRVDPGDSRVRVAAAYDAVTAGKLTAGLRRGLGAARARALGVAAIRETFEETGVLLGRPGGELPRGDDFAPFAARGIGIDLSALGFLLRAVTPPGRPRRFDTRFFVADRAAVADVDETRVGQDAELEEVRWVGLDEARRLPLATITLTVLDELCARLADDPALPAAAPVPFYRWVRGGFVRTLL